MSNNTLRGLLIAIAVVLTIAVLIAIGVYAVAFIMLGPMMAAMSMRPSVPRRGGSTNLSPGFAGRGRGTRFTTTSPMSDEVPVADAIDAEQDARHN